MRLATRNSMRSYSQKKRGTWIPKPFSFTLRIRSRASCLALCEGERASERASERARERERARARERERVRERLLLDAALMMRIRMRASCFDLCQGDKKEADRDSDQRGGNGLLLVLTKGKTMFWKDKTYKIW